MSCLQRSLHRPPVRKDIHALFDEGKLILLPEQDIVNEYMMGKGKPDFEGDVCDLALLVVQTERVLIHDNQRRNNVRYKYTLIASPDMDRYSLRRLRFPAQPGESQEPMVFSYPFADFPTLESHVHPCFAICHAGRISNVYKFFRGISTELSNRLTFVANTYYRWEFPMPCLEFRKNPKLSPDDDDDRSDAGKTRMYRVDHFSFLQRIRNHKNSDPPKGRRKEREREWDAEQHDCYDGKRCIDLHNLRSISGFFSGIYEDPNERKRKLVRNWVSSIIGQTFVEDDDRMSQMDQT
jgi:hypothetical protein